MSVTDQHPVIRFVEDARLRDEVISFQLAASGRPVFLDADNPYTKYFPSDEAYREEHDRVTAQMKEADKELDRIVLVTRSKEIALKLMSIGHRNLYSFAYLLRFYACRAEASDGYLEIPGSGQFRGVLVTHHDGVLHLS